MKYVITYQDGKGKWYFSHFGLWNLPLWVGKSQIAEARIFETRQGARQWISEFLGTQRKYSVEEFKK